MEQDDEALPAALGGDQRRSVGERCPGAVGQGRIGLRQDLPVHGDIGRHRHAEERAFAGERSQLLRLVPGQAAAQDAAAAPQLHRHEIVVAGSESRAGEAHEHAAFLDPARKLLARLGDVADISEDQHRQALLDELAHRLRRGAAVGEPHVGEGAECAAEIIGRSEQRLGGIGSRAGDYPDRAPAPALVEKRHRAGRALAGNLQSCDVVADLDRQRELGLALAFAVLEVEAGVAERQALEVERAHGAGFRRPGAGAQHLHRKSAGGVVGARKRACRRRCRLPRR